MTELFHKYRVFMETHIMAYEPIKILLLCTHGEGHKNDMQRCWICPGGQPVTNC